MCDAIKFEDGDSSAEGCFRAQTHGQTAELIRDYWCDRAAFRIMCDAPDAVDLECAQGMLRWLVTEHSADSTLCH